MISVQEPHRQKENTGAQSEVNAPSPWQHLLALIALPGVVVLVVPAILLTRFPPARPWWQIRHWTHYFSLALGMGLISGSTLLAAATMFLFARRGRGTLAPWQPPTRLVIQGPYRHIRNPMISAVAGLLFGQAALLASAAILIWALLFCAVNIVYIPLFEEPDLVRRFSQAYLTYQQHVPRWLPRLSPWQPENRPDLE